MSGDRTPQRRSPGPQRRTLLARAVLWFRHNVEIGSLLFLVAVVAAGWAFAELAEEVVAGTTSSLDRDILLLLRSPGDIAVPLGPPWLQEMARDATALGGVMILTLATGATAGFFLLRRQFGSMVYLLATVGGGILISGLAKEFFSRARPDLVPHGSIVLTSSFPSGHSMMAAIAYLTLGVLIARTVADRSVKIYVLSLAIAITILVGISRVYLGVHWPTDVLAGWIAGAGWAMACLLGAKVLSRSGRVEPEADEGDTPVD